jgi:hypothetical protein
MKNARTFCLWFVLEALAFALVVANGRAYNQGNYMWTFVTDAIIQVNGFLVGAKFIKDTKDAEGHDWFMIVGGAIGGASGSLAAIWATVHLYGK